MKIILGDFRRWRLKRFFILLTCMMFSLGIARFVDDKWTTVIFLIGLLVYALLERLPFINNNQQSAYVTDKDDEIDIRIRNKEYRIIKNKIKSINLKEIPYGGRWLDIIGYRLVIIADKKYIFDSVFQENLRSTEEQEIIKLKNIFEGET